MSALVWDQTGQKQYETGTDHGVVYPYDSTNNQYSPGVAWNGLTAVTESPSGAEATPLYADNIKYLELRSAEEFGCTIEAYTYPDEFAVLDGTASLVAGVTIGQQKRGLFGFSYRSRIGNDTDGDSHGYKLHLVYGCTASPSEKAYQTVNDSPDAIQFSWEVSTTPVNVTGYRPTSVVTIDSTKADATKLAALEAILYGTDAVAAQAATYQETTDESYQSSKTYYTKSGDVYSEFEGSAFAQGTTYYELATPAVSASEATVARLPLPDEVKTIMTAS